MWVNIFFLYSSVIKSMSLESTLSGFKDRLATQKKPDAPFPQPFFISNTEPITGFTVKIK